MSPILGIWASAKSPAIYANSYESIATTTVGAGGSSTVTFSSIPSTYKHLQLRFSATTAADANIRHYVNSDTSANKAAHELVGYGTSGPNAGGGGGESQPVLSVGQNTYPVVGIVDFLDYADTNKYKVWRTLTGTDSNAANLARLFLKSTLWQSTSAITSITLVAESTTFNQYSSFALYGIKGA